MKILLVLLLLLPSLINADYGCCEEDWEQTERERKMDKEYYGCRSCFRPIQMSESSCPINGYECYQEWPVIASVLAPHDVNRCAEAKCAGKAKWAVDGEIVNSQFRCNNSQWTVNGEAAENVICAKPCNKNVCLKRHPMNLPDFLALNASDATEGCAIGQCDPEKGMVVLKDDGIIEHVVLENEVTCTGDGKWKKNDDTKWKYVMCNASPCGPTKCPAFKKGLGMESGEVQELVVTGKGASCATASCPTDATFVEVKDNGEVGESLAHVAGFSCTEEAAWKTLDGTKEYPYVMCQKKLCENHCIRDPFETDVLFANRSMTTLFPALRDGCTYSCPDGKSMFTEGGSTIVSIPSAVCGASGMFTVDGIPSGVERIGCWECDVADVDQPSSTGEARIRKCVMSCDNSYILQYTVRDKPGQAFRVPFLLRWLSIEQGQPAGRWLDGETTLDNPDCSCQPSGASND